MTPNEPSGADIDPSGLYRFSLWRTFARVVIGTASHRLGFVTIGYKCIGWGSENRASSARRTREGGAMTVYIDGYACGAAGNSECAVVAYDGLLHPAIYCRRCCKALDTNEQTIGWCRSCDLVEAVRVFGAPMLHDPRLRGGR